MNLTEHWLTEPVTAGIDRLAKKSLAIDVGANAGTWTTELAKKFNLVIAVEPDSRVSPLIPRDKNVHIVSAAVGGTTGDGTFYKRATTGHGSLSEKHPIGGDGMAPVPVIDTEEVAIVTLDDLAQGGADFVKIDIEGGEVDALKGCQKLDNWKRTFFIVECHDTFDAVLEELTRLGKSIQKVPHPLQAHPGHCWAIGEPT